MSFFGLPKEIRIEIWALAYFSQPPRLVALRTKPHDEAHNEQIFCPRYSPSPAPVVVDICKEARAEAYHQARKSGHIVRLHHGPLVAGEKSRQSTEEFYFRFETDILHLPLEDEHVKHFDDSPDVGFLRHFRNAVDCDPSLLRTVAVTQVVPSGYHDGSLTNTLRDFPNISRMVMMISEGIWTDKSQKALLVRAAQRIVNMYELDMETQSSGQPKVQIDVDFATLVKGKLALVPKKMWKDWTEPSTVMYF